MVFLYGFVFIKKAKLIAVVLFTDAAVGVGLVGGCVFPAPRRTSLFLWWASCWEARMMEPWALLGGLGQELGGLVPACAGKGGIF